MRNTFVASLVEEARVRDEIVLVVGDLGYSVIEPFADEFPERFFNAGVAEQGMVSMAAGLASEGCHVFTYSIANFPTFRCAEQIRNDVDYHKLPVTTVVVGGGLGYGALGYSHHAVQDFALMRSFPNMLIGSPVCPVQVRQVLSYFCQHPQPSYLRLGKAGELPLSPHEADLIPGGLVPLAKTRGTDVALVTTGRLIQSFGTLLKEISRTIDCVSLPIWGQSTQSEVANSLRKYKQVIVLEDHLVFGGFGSYLLEINALNGLNLAIHVVGFENFEASLVGSESYLLGQQNIGRRLAEIVSNIHAS